MTDDELREAAARALGWEPRDHSALPLDWTTAGALLEKCNGLDVLIECLGHWNQLSEEWEYVDDINVRNVIEACVIALEG